MAPAASRIEEARNKMRWQNPPIHPEAAKLPMMSDVELDKLAEDIKANGLQQPLIQWEDNSEAANGSTGPFPLYLLDGRNRLEALRRIGITDPFQAPRGALTPEYRVRTMYAVKRMSTIGRHVTDEWVADCNPVTYVLSANVHRRHLSSAQKRDAIAAYLEADPIATDRKVAKDLSVSPTTVGDVRKNTPNVQDGHTEHGQMEHLPVERAKRVLRENPALTAGQLVKLAGVGWSTAYKARDQLIAAGEIDDPQTETKPMFEPPPKPEPKKKTTAQRNGERLTIAIQQLATLTADQGRVIKTIGRLAAEGLSDEQRTILTEQADTLHNHSVTIRPTTRNQS